MLAGRSRTSSLGADADEISLFLSGEHLKAGNIIPGPGNNPASDLRGMLLHKLLIGDGQHHLAGRGGFGIDFRGGLILAPGLHGNYLSRYSGGHQSANHKSQQFLL